MSFGKITAVTLGLAGAFALGVWTGPYVNDRHTLLTENVGEPVPAGEAVPGSTLPSATSAAAQPAPAPARIVVVPASRADLHARLKPVLNPGMNLPIAAKGFRDAEEFAAVAHAARNTGAPFMVLKHRVLNERKSLATAIRESKPSVNAVAEANRARTMARADVAAISG